MEEECVNTMFCNMDGSSEDNTENKRSLKADLKEILR